MEDNLNSNESVSEVVATQPIEQVTTTEPSVEKVEIAEQPKVEDKPVQTQDENAKYANIRREYEAKIATETASAAQKGRDEWIASQGYEWNGKPIATESEYNQALLEKSYQDKGIDVNVLNEAVANNPTVRQAQENLTKQEKAAKDQAQYNEFSAAYPNVKGEEISQDVWNAFNSGIPLKIAYAAHQENATLKAQLAEFKKGQKTLETNNKNALTSTGSTIGNGALPNDFIAKDVFEANKKDSNWMSKNYDSLKSSYPKW